MTQIVIAYHSGYGHTQKQAEAVAEGVKKAGAQPVLLNVANITDADWATLDAADGIVFGSPTYMGGVSAEFKKFADASSKPWYQRKWQDKVAGGFTNSASLNGDKQNTLQYLWTLASQHGMLWVSLGLLPSNAKAAQRNDVNYLGGSGGVLAQSPSDSSPAEGPLPGDLETAKLYGERIAKVAIRLKS